MSRTTQLEPEAAGPQVAPRALPELLSPAGDWDCARAAVENGADAIYFGLDKFNARMRARNFMESDLPELMDFLHHRGVKGYVTLNTLVFENELAEAEVYLRTMIAAGVDAVIVQDVGICRLIRRLSPDFPIHSSTQMTITSPAGVSFARDLGCSLVVLARECPIAEIARIAQAATGEDKRSVPVEVFVHGALCVAYSGQCLTSESLGGRSANRGECAQACRMPYDLFADGKQVALGDRKYLLSPQDLSGLPVLPDLVRAGVASLKIEGRLKSPEYVANITQIYRHALDELRFTLCDLHTSETAQPVDARTQYDLEMAFSRGLHTGWMEGINNQKLVHGRFGKKRGVYLGEVRRVLPEKVLVDLQNPLKPGDGIVFDAGKPEEKEEGGRVYGVRSSKSKVQSAGSKVQSLKSNVVELEFGRGDIDFSRVHVGDKVWKTSDVELDRRLRRSYEGGTPQFQRPLSMEIHGSAGLPLAVLARDEVGNVVRVDSTVPLVEARQQPLTEDRLRQQLGRLGGTPFLLDRLSVHLVGDVLLPVSELNRLRRKIVADLERLRTRPGRWTLLEAERCVAVEPPPAPTPAAPELVVLVRNLEQLDVALGCGIRVIYCDFENPKKYREAVQHFRQATPRRSAQDRAGDCSIWVAPPRIFKMGEDWILNQVRSCEADGYLVRNYDHLKFFSADRRIGDYSLNIANRLSAEYFRNTFGLERVTASYDLNVHQLESLLLAAPPEWFEVTIHQHMPMFHMEHCVFCAFLSSGTDYTNCGRPCDVHALTIRDRVGARHPVKADAGCRNTVFNALAQTGAEFVSKLIALGVRHCRVEFLNESPSEARETISKYRQLLGGEISGTQLWRDLKLFNQLGVTRGQMAGAAETRVGR